ncbi:MAG: hypothetical protein OCC49_19770, partial [Fibrobacterales bacterium]
DIDEVRLWKDVRTASEIYYDHYNAYEDLNSTDNLVAYWDANQVSGSLLKDEVGGHTGTLTNMETGDWAPSWTRRTLTVASSANGSNNVNGTVTVMDNRWFYINGTPDVSYVFIGWTDDASGVAPTFSDAAAASSWVSITGGDGGILGSFGQVENGLYFDGTNDYVDLPDFSSGSPSFSSGITFEAWVKWEATNNWARVIELAKADNTAHSNIYICGEGTGNTLRLDIFDSGGSVKYLQSGSFIETGKWIHIAGTIANDGEAHIYKNGTLVSSAIGAQALYAPNDVLRQSTKIGWGNNTSDGKFQGTMDNVRIWNDVRTATEIKNNMHATLTGAEGNLVASYDFNNASGTTADDLQNSHDGTLVGTPAWVTSYDTYSVTIASGSDGAVSPSGAQTFVDGAEYQIVATPDGGFMLTNWAKTAGAGTVTLDDANAETTTASVTGGDATITATFEVDFDPGYVDNAQFKSGTTGWTNQIHSGAAQSFSIVSEEAVIAVTGTGGDGNRWNNNIMQEFSGTTEILVSTNYTVSFDIKANKASVDYFAQMYGHTSSSTSPSGALGGQSGTITTSWQTVSFTWSHGGAYNYKYLNIGFGGVDQAGLAPYTVYIDNVSIIAQ